MAIIRIKRSTGTTSPASLKTAEIAYAMGTGTQANAGDRLFFGKGDDGSGNATTIVVVGGEYFTNMLDHVAGTLTHTSAIITDASKKIDNLIVDNIDLNGNTISTTDTNGNLTLSPNGSGTVDVATSKITSVVDPTGNQDAATKKYVDDQFGGAATVFSIAADAGTTDDILGSGTVTFNGDDWLTTTVTDNTITITHDTSGVSAGTYGSATAIPVFTVDDRGHIDSAGTIAVATDLTVAADAGSNQTISLLTDTLTIEGGTNIHSVASAGDKIIIHLDSDVQDLSGLNVNGAVDIVGDLDVDNININGNAIISTDTNGNIALTPNGSGEVVASTLTVSDLTATRLVLAGTSGALEDNTNLTFNGTQLSIGAGNFTVQQSSGNVYTAGTLEVDGEATLASAIIEDLTDNRILVAGTGGAVEDDANLTWNGTTLGVTGNISHSGDNTITGQLTVDNININGNTISSTDGSNTMYIDPSPVDSDGGTLVIRGNLTVQGTQTIVNSTTVSINDLNMVLADSAGNAAAADGAGLTIGGAGYSGTQATFTYNGANDEWEMNKTLNLTDSNSLEFAGVNWKEVMEDHLVNNVFIEAEGLDITYNDGTGTITFAAELASSTNKGVASFDATEFSVSTGVVTVGTIDGGTF
jgi:trimeric autotransporter adhesin